MKKSTWLLILGGGALALYLFSRSNVGGKPVPKAPSKVGGSTGTNVWDFLTKVSVTGIGRLTGGSGGNSTPSNVGEQPDGSWDISGSWGGTSSVSDWSTDEDDF